MRSGYTVVNALIILAYFGIAAWLVFSPFFRLNMNEWSRLALAAVIGVYGIYRAVQFIQAIRKN
jgi:uncharacterized membrane protein